MQLVRTILIGLAAAALSFANDINGKWKGDVQTDNGPMTLTFDLKADGENLTGSVSSHMGEISIHEGKVKGEELTWVLLMERNGNQVRINNKAKLTGKEMKVTISVEGRDVVMECVAKKAD